MGASATKGEEDHAGTPRPICRGPLASVAWIATLRGDSRTDDEENRVTVSPDDGIAWVTGASSGIGRALAERLIGAGWTVAVTARRSVALADLAAAHGERVIVAPADVADAAAMAAAHDAIRQAGHGEVALLIANAGRYSPGEALAADAFRAVIEVNLIGAANTLAPVLPGMLARGRGQVVLVASLAGLMGLPGASAYGASKAALINWAESLRLDLSGRGIHVQVVNPGFVATPMTAVNRFPMPFLMPVEAAAARIVAGLASRRFEIAFPRRLAWPMKLVRLLPYRLTFPLIAASTRARR